MSDLVFVRKEMTPPSQPPVRTTGAGAWIRSNLFSSPGDTILTLLAIAFVAWIVPPLYNFFIGNAVFSDPEGLRGEACRFEGVGACWIFIQGRFSFFIYGFYPAAEVWRVNIVFALGAALLAALLVPGLPFRRVSALLFFVVYPVVAYILIAGGMFGLRPVSTNQWGGLMLTLMIAMIGIIVAIPLGIVLALGRQSSLPIVRAFCVAYIELWRAVPLITVLFMASVMLPLFMPQGVNPDTLLRAIIGICLFQSAYMAEAVRGGLQAMPRGQYEAASALGLSKPKTMGLIILPQALKHVLPDIVNNAISLFKDTSLISIIGLFELLNTVRAAGSDVNWSSPTHAVTGYIFAAFIFWVFCFSMSRYSMYVENRLNTGYKR